MFDHICTFVFQKVNILTLSWGTKGYSGNENSKNTKSENGAQSITQEESSKGQVITKKS